MALRLGRIDAAGAISRIVRVAAAVALLLVLIAAIPLWPVRPPDDFYWKQSGFRPRANYFVPTVPKGISWTAAALSVYLSLLVARSDSASEARERAMAVAGAHTVAVMAACLETVLVFGNRTARIFMPGGWRFYPFDHLACSLWGFAPLIICMAASAVIMRKRVAVYACAGATLLQLAIIALSSTVLSVELALVLWLG